MVTSIRRLLTDKSFGFLLDDNLRQQDQINHREQTINLSKTLMSNISKLLWK